jgi:hypothetical protein
MKTRHVDDRSGATRMLQPTESGATSVDREPRASHITEGRILWTLTHEGSTAQARRWFTPTGVELQLQIWTGPLVEGHEDLCWTQLFASDRELTTVADAKKTQLQGSGWLEQIDVIAR